MKLPALQSKYLRNKRILLRMDTDVPVEGRKVLDDTRLRASIPTIKYLLQEECGQIVVLGHRGRPGGKTVSSLSLSTIAKHLEKLLKKELGHDFEHLDMYMAENLRFFPGEEKNDPKFVKELASNGDVYVNDAFGSSVREHASVVGLPYVLPHAAGFSLVREVEALSKVLEKPKKPVVFVLGGGKGDKALLIPKLLKKCDWLLVGGLLPKMVRSYGCEREGGMCVSAAHLTPKGEDITPDSAHNFAEIIKTAGTIVWGGPMGDIDSAFWDGTKVVGMAIGESSAYKVAGGGDTIHAINKFKLGGQFDHISMGGGAMLEFLAYGDLPGLKALRS